MKYGRNKERKETGKMMEETRKEKKKIRLKKIEERRQRERERERERQRQREAERICAWERLGG